ncbi:STAS domain-containing protein [Streptomyces sp. NPDC052020]|uniref:STAS domain-containing protein n=1 Tax=Streptomyces sp. NPDC052020 TaxID=3155677 RepID=UPI00342C33E4
MTFLPHPSEPGQPPGCTLLALPPEIDYCNAEAMLDLVLSAIGDPDDGLRLLVLDLSGTRFMDSQGVRLVNDVRQRLHPRARVRVVARPGGVASRVLELTGLRRDVPVYDNVAEALRP